MRILIIDREFLVAMEAERILTEALPCEVHIATLRTYPEELKRQRFDVIVIDSVLLGAEEGGAARWLREAGAGLVFTTLGAEDLSGIEGWAGIPVVAKPFQDCPLIEAVRSAARD